MRVLVVEDESDLLEVFAQSLRADRYAVDTVPTDGSPPAPGDQENPNA